MILYIFPWINARLFYFFVIIITDYLRQYYTFYSSLLLYLLSDSWNIQSCHKGFELASTLFFLNIRIDINSRIVERNDIR